MIVEGDHKLICDVSNDACRAFDLVADPAERKNRIEAAWAGPLRERLETWMAEEARFEASGPDPRVARTLDRARLGDGSVAHLLPPLLADASLNREVARLLAVLPPDPANRDQPMRALDPVSRDWLRVAGARLGERESRDELGRALPRLCAPQADAELCARAALAAGDLGSEMAALERAQSLDEPLQRALIAALGRAHDPRALDTLMIALGNVRTRLDCVTALTALDDPRALPTLLLWLPNEPYVPVRAAMATLVATLAQKSPGQAKAALAVLSSLAASEHEPPVMAAAVRALSRARCARGRRSVAPPGARPGRRRAVDRRQRHRRRRGRRRARHHDRRRRPPRHRARRRARRPPRRRRRRPAPRLQPTEAVIHAR